MDVANNELNTSTPHTLLYTETRMRLSHITNRAKASRKNGRLATGPKTSQGKQISSLNALKHGILADIACMPAEKRDGFHIMLDDFIAKIGPADGVEYYLMEQLAMATWRMRRVWAADTASWSAAMEKHRGLPVHDSLSKTAEDVAKSPAPHLIARYETTLLRSFKEGLHHLFELSDSEPVPDEDSESSQQDQPKAA